MSRRILPGQTSEDFEDIQEKNKQLLADILAKREVNETLQSIGEIREEEWRNIKASMKDLRAFVEGGGITTMLSTVTDNVENVLNNNIETALAPITNTINETLNSLISPILPGVEAIVNSISASINSVIDTALAPIMDLLNDALLALGNFISGNETGAFFGALIGYIGGPAYAVIGAIFGAILESYFNTVETVGMGWSNVSEQEAAYRRRQGMIQGPDGNWYWPEEYPFFDRGKTSPKEYRLTFGDDSFW